MISIDNGTTAPGQNSRESGVTIAMADMSGPFEHILQAKMSIHYNVAAALAHGDFAERNYVPQQNPDVQALAKRVTVQIDPAFTSAFPAKQGAAIVVRTRGGETLEQSADNVEATDPDGVHAMPLGLGRPPRRRHRADRDGAGGGARGS